MSEAELTAWLVAAFIVGGLVGLIAMTVAMAVWDNPHERRTKP